MEPAIVRALRKIYEFSGIPYSREGTLPFYFRTVIRGFVSGVRSVVHFFSTPQKKTLQSLPRIGLWSGIGDSLWSLVLIDAVLKKLNATKVDIVVHVNPGDIRNGRANSYLERFPFVNSITSQNYPLMKYPPLGEDGYLRYTEPGIRKDMPFDYLLVINTYLEKGYGFDYICEKLELDPSLINYDPFKKYQWHDDDFDEARRVENISPRGYCVFYMCSLKDNTESGLNRGGLWTIDDWLLLARKIYDYTGYKIVIVGATYDVSYVEALQKKADVDFHKYFINDCGTIALPETLGLLKKAQFVIGLPSGIPISSVYLRVRTAMFWRPQQLSMDPSHKKWGFHKDFSTNWVPKEMLSTGDYIPFWYSVDHAESVFATIKEHGWLVKSPEFTLNTDS